ncbi:MAG: glycosyltransferase [Thermodesulfobacteriota bacterium]
MIIVALIIFLFSLLSWWQITFCPRRLTRLPAISASPLTSPPRVSIIVPACNEEAAIRDTLTSLDRQDYPNLEIIVINDRSTDNTGPVIKELLPRLSRVRLIEVSRLPEGWLGKAHALYLGARQADGDYLLFTDGDVVMEGSTLSRAVARMVSRQLDHLAIIFQNSSGGGLLNGIILDSLCGLFLLLKPWKAADKHSKYFIGVGAFNMVKRSTYEDIGGHRSIRMHPIDDIMLGKRIKEAGGAQECLKGEDFLNVPWYSTVQEMINGLMKNVFALYNYNIAYLAAGALIVFFMTIFPFWSALLTTGITRSLFITALFVRFLMVVSGSRFLGLPLASCLYFLITPYLIIFIMVKGCCRTLMDRGITWRGSHYPLAELKKSEPLISIKWLLKPI